MWRNRLCFHLQVKYYLHSSSILVALNWIAEAENHFSPEECGGIDYASIYRLSITYTAPPFLLPSVGLLRRRIISVQRSVAEKTMLPSAGITQLLYASVFRIFLKNYVKGTVPRDFRLLVFFMNQFPPSPEYTIKAVSNFFNKNLWRCSQLKMHHRCR
jgi:hypothetical protein